MDTFIGHSTHSVETKPPLGVLANGCDFWMANCSDIANPAGLHYVVRRFKRFFDRRLVIPAVDLIQVHVVGSETTQALVEFIKDFFAREALAIRLVAHLGMHLSRDDNGFASSMCTQKSSKDLFAGPR